MSWDEYVSNQLIATGNVKMAAICGLDGTTWASSEGFTVSTTEVKALVNGFNDTGPLAMSGMKVGGTKFMYLSGNEGVLRGKMNQQGIHVAKTNTAVIIAVYEEPIQPGQCAVTVEALADYLKTANY